MKKTSKNKMKKLPVLLGTLLIISVAAYGTRAYFSDSAELQGNIELSLGNVDISSTATNWTYQPIAGTDTNLEVNENLNPKTLANGEITQTAVTNVRPGDSFTKTYTITNTGSLDVDISKEDLVGNDTNSTNGVYQDGPFTVTIDALKTASLIPDGTTDIQMTITVNPETINNEYNAGHDKFNNLNNTARDYLKDVITVKAVQTNVE